MQTTVFGWWNATARNPTDSQPDHSANLFASLDIGGEHLHLKWTHVGITFRLAADLLALSPLPCACRDKVPTSPMGSRSFRKHPCLGSTQPSGQAPTPINFQGPVGRGECPHL